jgi:hypothetical protein
VEPRTDIVLWRASIDACISPSWCKFSKVSALLYLPQKVSIESTFRECGICLRYLPAPACGCLQPFAKVRYIY